MVIMPEKQECLACVRVLLSALKTAYVRTIQPGSEYPMPSTPFQRLSNAAVTLLMGDDAVEKQSPQQK